MGKYIAEVERDCEVSLPFKPRTKYKAEIISLENSSPPPSTSSIKDSSGSMNAWQSDDLASNLSFEMRKRWGKNVTKPLNSRDIGHLEKKGWVAIGSGEGVIVKKDEISEKAYLRQHLQEEDEYYLGCWNEDIYYAVSPGLTALLKNESYEALGMLVKEKYFEEFLEYIYEHFDLSGCVRNEYSFEYGGYQFFLQDVDYWEDIKENY